MQALKPPQTVQFPRDPFDPPQRTNKNIVLHPEDAYWLRYRGSLTMLTCEVMLLEDTYVSGWRHIFPLPGPFIRLPIILESPEYFYWLGFERSASLELHLKHVLQSSGGEPSYYYIRRGQLGVALDHLERHGVFDYSQSMNAWRESLIESGVRELDIISSFLNLPLIKMNGATSPKQFFLDVLEIRDRILQVLMLDSRLRFGKILEDHPNIHLQHQCIYTTYNIPSTQPIDIRRIIFGRHFGTAGFSSAGTVGRLRPVNIDSDNQCLKKARPFLQIDHDGTLQESHKASSEDNDVQEDVEKDLGDDVISEAGTVIHHDTDEDGGSDSNSPVFLTFESDSYADSDQASGIYLFSDPNEDIYSDIESVVSIDSEGEESEDNT